MIRVILALSMLGMLCRTGLAISYVYSVRILCDTSDAVTVGTGVGAGEGACKVSLTEHLKGKADVSGAVDLTGCREEDRKAIQSALADGRKEPAIVFLNGKPGGEEAKANYLHVAGVWLELTAGKDGAWTARQPAIIGLMRQAFPGSTEMLIRATRDLIEGKYAGRTFMRVPAGVRWLSSCKVATLKEDCTGLAAIRRAGEKNTLLFVASPGGDRLFRCRAKEEAFDEITGETKLAGASRRFCWLDVNADGQPDLVSFDGEALRVWLDGGAKGFSPAGEQWTSKLDDCAALAACSNDPRPGLLVSTAGKLFLLAGGKAGWVKSDLPAGPEGASPSAAAGPALVGDFNNDGYADIILPGVKGGLLWKGKPGGFDKPVATPVGGVGREAKGAVADFTDDGAPDVVLAGKDRLILWANDGAAGFRDATRYSGSLAYKPAAALPANEVRAFDLNHDGRPDACIAYAGAAMQYHFNRGFVCFGEEDEVRLPELMAGPERRAPVGQKHLAQGDFNGDGSLDLAAAGANREIHVYFNDAMDMPILRLRLPAGTPGMANATVWLERTGKGPLYCGLAGVQSGTPAIEFAVERPEPTGEWAGGTVLIKYRAAGGKPSVKRVAVSDRAVDVILTGSRAR